MNPRAYRAPPGRTVREWVTWHARDATIPEAEVRNLFALTNIEVPQGLLVKLTAAMPVVRVT